MRGELLSKHGSGAMNFEGVAAAMVSNGHDTFKDRDGFIMDVLDLKADTEDFVEEAKPDKTEEGEEDGDNKKKSQKPWVDRDHVISSTVWAVKTTNDTFQAKGQSQLTKQEAYLKELKDSAQAAFQDSFSGEMKSLAVRLEGLRLVFHCQDESELKQYIGRFSADEEGAGASEAPPCDAYANLRPMAVLHSMVEQYKTCTQPEQEVSQQISAARAPITQLLSQANRVEKSLKTGLDKFKKTNEKKAAEMQKAKEAEPAGSLVMFDQGAALATQFQHYKVADITKDEDPVLPNFSRPFIIQVNEWSSDAMKEGSPMRIAVDEFGTSFDSMRGQQKGCRASKAITASGDFDFASLVHKLFEKAGVVLPVDALDKPLQDQMVPTVFGIDKGYDKVSLESGSMACVRYTLSGTRILVVADTMQLVGFMQRKGVSGHITTSRMSSFFRCMSVATLTEFQTQCTLFSATVGPGDLVFLPVGAVVGENAQGVVKGLRLPVVTHGSVDQSIALTFRRRKSELETLKSGAQAEEAKTKMTHEIEVVDALLKAVTAAKAAPATS
eukprot:g31076.t1